MRYSGILGLTAALLVLGGCCQRPAENQASTTTPAPAAAQLDNPTADQSPAIPPAQARPAYLGPGIKWAPESPRYQQIRREAYREGTNFAEKVDTSPRRSSRSGRYAVEVLDRPEPQIGEFQTWVIAIADAKGKPVIDAQIHVKGGMPEHGHGLPSKPTVGPGKIAGQYEIQGLQFGMPGWWEVTLYISSQQQDDSVTLNLIAG